MGGTFNPIHFGHLVTAAEAISQFELEEVIFMPTGHPPHKKDGELLPGEERYLMSVIATASNSRFSVSRLETERPGPSYTIDTVQMLSKQFGEDSSIFFITGADAVLEILTWKNPEKIARYCSFIAATRPGYDLDKFQVSLKKAKIQGQKLPDVHMMEVPALAISSTDIRLRVRTCRPINYLTPEPVVNYIFKKGFYKR